MHLFLCVCVCVCVSAPPAASFVIFLFFFFVVFFFLSSPGEKACLFYSITSILLVDQIFTVMVKQSPLE